MLFSLGENVPIILQDLSCGGDSHDTTPISLIKSDWFDYFCEGEIFTKKAISQKKAKITPCQHFHVYNIC